jgi:type II secretory pathway component PulF
MKNKIDYAQVIEFCHIILIISKSEGRISDSLSALLTKDKDNDNHNKAFQWAQAIAQNLEQGHSIEESCKILENIDPVLNRLLPLILKKQLYNL